MTLYTLYIGNGCSAVQPAQHVMLHLPLGLLCWLGMAWCRTAGTDRPAAVQQCGSMAATPSYTTSNQHRGAAGVH